MLKLDFQRCGLEEDSEIAAAPESKLALISSSFATSTMLSRPLARRIRPAMNAPLHCLGKRG
jgi:hypothetical protein